MYVFTKLNCSTWFLFCVFCFVKRSNYQVHLQRRHYLILEFVTLGTVGMETLLNFECFDNPPHHERRWQEWHYCHFDIELTLSRMNLWREPSSKIATSLLHSVQKISQKSHFTTLRAKQKLDNFKMSLATRMM